MSHCFFDGQEHRSLNKAITSSPWSCEALNKRRHELVRHHHQNGFSVGILDSTFIHHPRGESIYGVYKYFDYIEGCYTYASKLVTSAISTNDRVSGLDLRIYHRSFQRQECLYLEHTDIDANEPKREPYLRRLKRGSATALSTGIALL